MMKYDSFIDRGLFYSIPASGGVQIRMTKRDAKQEFHRRVPQNLARDYHPTDKMSRDDGF
jgi:hypothetical protein